MPRRARASPRASPRSIATWSRPPTTTPPCWRCIDALAERYRRTPLPAGRGRDRRGVGLARMAARRAFHPARNARARLSKADAPPDRRRRGPRAPARPRGLRAALEPDPGRHDARDRCLPRRAAGADRHQGERALARPPPGPSRLRRRSSCSRTGGKLSGEVRIVGLFTATAYSAPGPRGALSAPQGRRGGGARRPRPDEPCRAHAARTCSRPIRATTCSRSTSTGCYRFALAIANLADRPRIRVLSRPDRFGRFVSLLVYVPKDRYDSTVRARIGAYLAEVYERPARRPPTRTSPKARWRAPTTSSAFRGSDTPERDPAALEAGVAGLVRTWGDALRDALAETMDGRGRARRSRTATPRPSRRPTARTSRRRSPSPTSRSWSA